MTNVFPDFSQLDADLRAEMFTSIPAPLADMDLDAAMETFIAFLALPQEVKNLFAMQEVLDDPATDCGYVRSKPKPAAPGKAAVLDKKEHFHFTTRTEERYGHLADDIPEARLFFDNAHHVALHARASFRKFLRAMLPHHPGLAPYLEPGLTQNGFLRFLKYDVQQSGASSAVGHFDRCGWTMALRESEKGLRFGKNKDAPKILVPYRKNRALIFPGLASARTTGDAYPPAYHDVIQVREAAPGATYARWALVMFFSECNTALTSHAATHPGLYKGDKAP